MRWVTVGALAGAVVLGIASESITYDWDEPSHWAPDLLVGWTLIGTGVAAWRWRQAPAPGALLVATGVTWFLGFGPATLYLHRGPLVHLLVAFAGWRPRSRLDLVAVVTGYVAAVATPLWASPGIAVALATGLVAVAVRGYVSAAGPARRERITALWAAWALSAVLVAGTVARATLPRGDAVPVALLAYEAVLAGIAVLVLVRLGRPSPSRVTDLVVELTEAPSGTLRERLAEVLRDPTLELGYWSPEAVAYVSDAGTEVHTPAEGNGRGMTLVDRSGARFALLVHDGQTLADPALVAAVGRAMRLSRSYSTLREQVDAQRTEVAASRRRLLVAADEERRRLAARLESGVTARLEHLDASLESVADRASRDNDTDRHLELARLHLDRVRLDLRSLARGLHPGALAGGGLAEALRDLASATPLPVIVETDVTGRLPPEVETAAYFVCAEALANIAKHAQAGEARVEARLRGGHLVLTVTDDGAGGADMGAGSGLRGLRDRAEALGGGLLVTSPAGGGTTVSTTLPAVAHHPPLI